MSVKFEKEIIKNTPIPGGKKHEIAHEIGERLTGGESTTGYLAVCDFHALAYSTKLQRLTGPATTGIPAAAAEEPASY